jgi:hypothetical protein
LDDGDETAETLPQLSLLMRHRGEISWGEPPDLLVEHARVALAQGRRVLNGKLEELLIFKFNDPIAGLIGGHLLLLEHDQGHRADLGLLDTVVTNLRSLVGENHPDVQALSLRCASETLRAVGPVVAPPMFERSLRILCQESEKHPELMPEALWKRALVGVTLPPFLVWADDDAGRVRYRRALARAVWAPLEEPALARARAPASAAANTAEAAMQATEIPAMGLAPPLPADEPAATPTEMEEAHGRAAAFRIPDAVLSALKNEYEEDLADEKR